MDALHALFPTTTHIVPYYRPIHAEKIHKFARYKYKRYFIQHFNVAQFPMRLPLLDEHSCEDKSTLAKGKSMKLHHIITNLHIMLFKAKQQRSGELCEMNNYNYKFNNPSYKVKSCI